MTSGPNLQHLVTFNGNVSIGGGVKTKTHYIDIIVSENNKQSDQNWSNQYTDVMIPPNFVQSKI